jgi:hypothetical protein
MLVTVTVAFGTTAPEESRSVPVNAPVAGVWLKSDGANISEQKTNAKQVTTNRQIGQRFKASSDMEIPQYAQIFLNAGPIAFPFPDCKFPEKRDTPPI